MRTSTLISRGALSVALAFSGQLAKAQTTAEPTTPQPAEAATPQSAEAAPEAPREDIIVTGTRFSGMTAADSAAPITVVAADSLTTVGQPNLIAALDQNLPAFEAQSRSGDSGSLTLTARLRGLSPNNTLVLVNGKRRHATANLQVLPGAYQGAASADLDLITPSAISRIEVLQDGAAAQYGSDAIAGVVNIILKRNDTGGQLTATVGQYYRGDGDTYDLTLNQGFSLGDRGFLTINAERRFRDHTNRTGPDSRLTDVNGVLRPNLGFDATQIPGFPIVGRNVGSARSLLNTIFFNAEYEIFSDINLYSFGSYGHRKAKSFGGYRPPNQAGFLALQFSTQQFLPPGSANPGCGNGVTPASGVNPCFQRQGGTYTTPGVRIFSTIGFNPQIELVQEDYALTFGVKGEIDGWNWDVSGTYGEDLNKLRTTNSGNASLFVNTHFSPTDFYVGSLRASELTGNLDVNKSFEVGLAEPLSVAFGFEARRNTYEIGMGEPASYFGIGAANYPGFGPTSALARDRHNYAGYLDIAIKPVRNLLIDVAGRHERYSDFGNATVGRITARYDFSEAFAVRGTASTGFRAPTLQEQFYTQTAVTSTAATVTLGPNSAGARAEGLSPLRPEKSTNYSIGFVAHPFEGLQATLDLFRISLRDRIVGTGVAPCKSNNVIISQQVCDAIAVNGNVLDPGVVTTGTTVFANSVDTVTKGLDFTVNYRSNFGDFGTINWTGAATYIETEISRLAPTPSVLTGLTLQTPTSIANLTTLSPKFKFVLGALWKRSGLSVNLRQVIYGPTTGYVTPGTGGTANLPVFATVSGSNYYAVKTPTAAITNIDIGYDLTKSVSLAVGVNNLFNKKAPVLGLQSNGRPLDNSQTYSAPLAQTPWGINGGFYYGRLTLNW